MRHPFIVCLVLTAALMAGGCGGQNQASEQADGPYEPSWSSLERYDEAPAWFRDAKFGIYLHWGVLSVPAFANDWYPRNMHVRGSREHRHQTETYGPLSAFGYHDFVPMFRAERFDPDAWAELFRRAGARFAGMVAEHHDGFSMWDSAVNPWNAVAMGPRRDLVGALEAAVHARGMRFVATFHMARNLQLYAERPEAQTDSSYFPYDAEMATASEDPALRILYGNIPLEQFYANWLAKLKEVIDRYHPDLIYFDGLLGKIPEAYKQEFLAHYFNRAVARGREVVVTSKNDELPAEVSLSDYEKGRMHELTPHTWLTDETVSTGSWSYVEGLEYKPAREILHVLLDVVSKNGSMMLNVSPRADGTIPEEQQAVLMEIGDWLGRYGEAVYETRPWTVYGEGPTQLDAGGHFLPRVEYSPADVRYTTRGDTVYAVLLGWPGARATTRLAAFAKARLGPGFRVTGVSMLGASEPVAWEWRADGLEVTTPSETIDDHAVVFAVTTSGGAAR